MAELPLADLVKPLKEVLQRAKLPGFAAQAAETRLLAHKLLRRTTAAMVGELAVSSPLPSCVLGLRVLRAANAAGQFTLTELGESVQVMFSVIDCLLQLGAPSSSKDPVESDDEVTAGVDGRADGAADKRPRWLTVESLRQVLRVALNAIAAAVSLVAAEMSAPTAVAVERKSWGVAGGGTKDGSTDFVCLSSQAVEGLGEWVWRELRRRWTALIGAARYDADAADALARTAAACVRHEPQLSAQLLHSSGGAASHHADGLYYGPSPLCDLLGAALASMQMLVELTKVRLRQQLKCTNLVCSSSGCNWQG